MRHQFPNFAAFLDAAAREPVTIHRESRRVDDRAKAFTGTASLSASLRLAREGWEEGRALCEAARAHFEHVTGSRVRRLVTVNDVAGFAPDVPAFLTGSPDCMFSREYVEAEGAGKIIRLVVQGAASIGVSTDHIMKRGALIVALIDALESAGRSVELTLDFSAEGKAKTGLSFVAKEAGEPVEIDRLAFILAHPSMLRRLAFSVWEQDAAFMFAEGKNGYGFCSHATDQGDLYIPGSDLRIINDGEAVTWFTRQLSAVGITFDA